VITTCGDETEEEYTAEDTTQDDKTGSRATMAVVETIVELLMQRAAGGGGVVHQAEEMGLQVLILRVVGTAHFVLLSVDPGQDLAGNLHGIPLRVERPRDTRSNNRGGHLDGVLAQAYPTSRRYCDLGVLTDEERQSTFVRTLWQCKW